MSNVYHYADKHKFTQIFALLCKHGYIDLRKFTYTGIMNTRQAEWRDIPGYEGLYQVSDDGRVYSFVSGRMHNPALSPTHYRTKLARNGVSRGFYVHALVAVAFLGPKPEGCEIHHKDFDRLDNSASNLEYVDQRKHKDIHTKMRKKATSSYRPKIYVFRNQFVEMSLPPFLQYIRYKFAKYGSQKAFCLQHGLSFSQLSDAISGHRPPNKAVCKALGFERIVKQP